MKNLFLLINALLILPFTCGASTWNLATTPQTASVSNFVHAENSSKIFAVTADDGVYRSFDGGQTWNRCLLTQEIQVATCAIVNDKGNLFVGSVSDGVFISTDDGSSWTSLPNGMTNKGIMSMAIDKNQNLYAGGWLEGGLYYSSNSGSNWISLGLENHDLTALFVDNKGIIYTYADQIGLITSSNLGAEWDTLDIPVNFLTDIVQASDSLIYFVYEDGILEYNNTTLTWDTLCGKIDGDSPKSLYFEKNLFLVGTHNKGIYRSTDLGVNWSFLGDQQLTSSVNDIAKYDKNRVLVSTNGGVYYSDYNFFGELLTLTVTPDTTVMAFQGDTIQFSIDIRGENGKSVSSALITVKNPISGLEELYSKLDTNAVVFSYAIPITADTGAYKFAVTGIRGEDNTGNAVYFNLYVKEKIIVKQKLNLAISVPSPGTKFYPGSEATFGTKVTEPENLPVKEARVVISDSSHFFTFSGYTNTDGEYAFSYQIPLATPPGNYEFTFSATKDGYYDSDVLKYTLTISENSSVFENDTEIFSVYPNPASDRIVLNYNDNFAASTIVIYNESGAVVGKYGEGVKTIDISGLSSGMYFVVAGSEKVNYTYKFEIRN